MQLKEKRWTYVIIGTIMMLSLGSLYAWSMFRAPFALLYPHWTGADLSLNFTISMVCYCAGGFLGGKLSVRTSNTVTTLAGAALLLAGFWGVSLLPAGDSAAALTQLYLFYGVCSGLGTGLCYNGVLTGVTGWFPDRNGLATGILLTGFGFGSMLIGQLTDALLPTLGLMKIFRLLAVSTAAILVAGARFVRLPGADVRLPSAPAAASAGQRELTPGEMVRRPSFWVFFTWNLLMCASGLMVVNSAANIASYYGAAAVLGLLLSVFNGASRIPFGVLVDKFGRARIMLLANGLLLLCGGLLTLGGLTHSAPAVLAGMLIMGVCYGNSVTINTLVIRQFYGNQHYAVNLSIANCCALPASLIGPLIANALQEAAGGDYTTTFLAVLAFAVVDLMVGLFVKKP